MKQDLAAEFAKATKHFGQPLDKNRLEEVVEQTTKTDVKRKTTHDPQVVQLEATYEITRQEFRKRQGKLIGDTLTKDRQYLINYFNAEYVAHEYE